MRYLLFTFLFFAMEYTYADTIYSCKETKMATIAWEEGGFLSKAGIEGKISDPSKDNIIITLVVSDKKAMFKGNNGESPLEIVAPDTYLEHTSSGNVFLWKLVSSSKGKFLVQTKAYELASSFYSHLWVFKCS